MIRSSLARGWREKTLIAVTVALGTTIACAIGLVLADAGDKVSQELRTYGANIMVRPRQAAALGDLYGVGSSATLSVAELPKLKTIFWAYNILDFAPFLDTQARLDDEPARTVGVWFDEHLSLPTGEELNTGVAALRSWWEVSGEWPAENDALIGRELASARGLSTGDTITVSGADVSQTLRIAGVVDTAGEFDDAVLIPIELAGAVSEQPGAANWVEVSALTTPDNDLARRAAANPDGLSAKDWETWYCTAYVSSIAYQIEEAIPQVSARALRQVAESEGIVLNRTQSLLLLVAGLCLIGTALSIANMVVKSVLERSREIGLLKAIGATDRAVLALVLAETLLVGAIGAVLGIAMGYGVAQIISLRVFGSGSAASPRVFALVLVAVGLVVLIGSWPAIRMLRKLRPAEVLHNG
jgi:putative ABC transport system permease protein